MLDNIIGNDKAKFMTNYNRLANVLNNFASPEREKNIINQYEEKQKFVVSKKEAKNNIFLEDKKKFEKWETMKNSLKKIKPAKEYNNPYNTNDTNNNNNDNFLFDRIRSNINKMKKQFDLEKEKDLFGNKIISPKNQILLTNKNLRIDTIRNKINNRNNSVNVNNFNSNNNLLNFDNNNNNNLNNLNSNSNKEENFNSNINFERSSGK